MLLLASRTQLLDIHSVQSPRTFEPGWLHVAACYLHKRMHVSPAVGCVHCTGCALRKGLALTAACRFPLAAKCMFPVWVAQVGRWLLHPVGRSG